jgi:serine/threonine protein kinase
LSIVGYSLPKRQLPAQIDTKLAVNGSLRDALNPRQRGNPLVFTNETGIAIIISEIVFGMRFVHYHRVIHQSLKLENIFLDASGFVQIANLGSRRCVGLDLTLTKQIRTPLDMAPDMYGDEEYTTDVDVFAFALILYEILVVERMFAPEITIPTP